MSKALIVGIDDYPENKLRCCVNDATALANTIDTNGDGSPNFDVILETNIQEKGRLLGLIEKLFEGNTDTALFYFSGHGYVDKLGGYIVTPDYSEDDWGISMNDILKIANASKIRNKIIILDCCHSGAIGQIKSGSSSNGESIIAEGVSILTSSLASEVSMEVNGHGVFTNLLLEALKGGAANINGKITPSSIYAYIDQALGEWDQRPIFKTNVKEFNAIKSIEPQVPISIIRNLTKYFKTPQDEFDLDPSYEYTNTNNIEHKVVEPYAKEENVVVFKELQKMASVGLIVPVDEEHMYFAAMNSKSCRLTALGYHYWNLVNKKQI